MSAQSEDAVPRRRRSRARYAQLQSCKNHVRHERRFSRNRLDEYFRNFVTWLVKFCELLEWYYGIQSVVAGGLPAQGLGRADLEALTPSSR